MLGELWTFSAPRHSPGPQILLHICNGVGSHTEQNTMTQNTNGNTHKPTGHTHGRQVHHTSTITTEEDDRQEEGTPQRERVRERSAYPSRREERRWKTKRKETETKSHLQSFRKYSYPLTYFTFCCVTAWIENGLNIVFLHPSTHNSP